MKYYLDGVIFKWTVTLHITENRNAKAFNTFFKKKTTDGCIACTIIDKQ